QQAYVGGREELGDDGQGDRVRGAPGGAARLGDPGPGRRQPLGELGTAAHGVLLTRTRPACRPESTPSRRKECILDDSRVQLPSSTTAVTPAAASWRRTPAARSSAGVPARVVLAVPGTAASTSACMGSGTS